jgi:hypothetical protein
MIRRTDLDHSDTYYIKATPKEQNSEAVPKEEE